MVGVPVGEHNERNRVRCQRGLVLFVVLTWVDNNRPISAGDPVRLCAVQSHGARIILLQHPHAVDGRSDCTLWGLIADSVRGAVFVRILLSLRHAPSMQEPPDSFPKITGTRIKGARMEVMMRLKLLWKPGRSP